MISLIISLMFLLAFGMVAIVFVGFAWWLIPVFIILLLAKACLKQLAKIFSKKNDTITMDRETFQRDYVKKSDSAT